MTFCEPEAGSDPGPLYEDFQGDPRLPFYASLNATALSTNVTAASDSEASTDDAAGAEGEIDFTEDTNAETAKFDTDDGLKDKPGSKDGASSSTAFASQA